MRKWQLKSGSATPLTVEETPSREPGPGAARIRVRAASLNFRDLLARRGTYPMAGDHPVVPLSDGAGDVVAVGAGVTRVAAGDRVTATTITNWIDGAFDPASAAQSIGFSVDGWLADEIVLPETALVKLPNAMSYESAATLACAGVTAWNAIVETARIGPGQHVLALGTGGVSMFAVQLGKLVGARVLVTSGSDDKIARARALGADDGVNYRSHPEWHAVVRTLTGGNGVDLVVETVGDIERSAQATRWNGLVAVIGLLSHSGREARASADGSGRWPQRNARVAPILMGNRRMLTRLVKAYALNGVTPVIDGTFTFDEAPDAFAALAAAQHVGKLVINGE